MPIDIKKTETVIDVIRNMSSAQLAVTIFLIVGAVWCVWFVDNRYAKMEDTRKSIEQTEAGIKKHKIEIMQMHVKTLELIKLQPQATQDLIEKNSKQFMDKYIELENSLVKK